MPAINDITLYNDVALGYTDTFSFRSTQGNSVRWANPDATGAGDEELTVTRTENDAVTRVVCSLSVPIVNDIGTGGIVVPVVVRTLRAKLEFVLPRASTQAERKQLRGHLYGLISDFANTATPCIAMIDEREGLS